MLDSLISVRVESGCLREVEHTAILTEIHPSIGIQFAAVNRFDK
jgi:hypothetical protein